MDNGSRIIKYEYDKIAAIETAKHESLLAIEQEEKEKQQILTYSISGGLVLLIFFFRKLFQTSPNVTQVI